jgi:hypothetical protein
MKTSYGLRVAYHIDHELRLLREHDLFPQSCEQALPAVIKVSKTNRSASVILTSQDHFILV